MNVSIAIPTYNRAGELEKTLAGLARLDTTDCPDHEVLVIDNNSTDTTREVVNRLACKFGGRLRYAREERQGLNQARNRAIAEAANEIVAYLDDDVDVDPRWLRHLCDAYTGGNVAGVGGRAYLIYPGPKPHWLGESLEGFLTKVELGPYRRSVGVQELYGVNLSFRKDWLRRAGGFRPDLDRVGTLLISGGDDEMIARVLALGGRMLYEPGAVVGHRVPPSRLTRKWFWNRCFWGHLGFPRTWPDRQVSGYELVRTSWHISRSAWRTAWAGLCHGPRSADCFEQLLKTTSLSGAWFGLIGELRRRGGFFGRERIEQPCPVSPSATVARTT